DSICPPAGAAARAAPTGGRANRVGRPHHRAGGAASLGDRTPRRRAGDAGGSLVGGGGRAHASAVAGGARGSSRFHPHRRLEQYRAASGVSARPAPPPWSASAPVGGHLRPVSL